MLLRVSMVVDAVVGWWLGRLGLVGPKSAPCSLSLPNAIIHTHSPSRPLSITLSLTPAHCRRAPRQPALGVPPLAAAHGQLLGRAGGPAQPGAARTPGAAGAGEGCWGGGRGQEEEQEEMRGRGEGAKEEAGRGEGAGPFVFVICVCVCVR